MDANMAMIITGGLTLVGVIITNVFSNKQVARDIKGQLEVSMAVTNTKLEDLTKQVEKHNQVIERTFKLEQTVLDMKEDIKELKDV